MQRSNSREIRIGGTRLVLVKGDITKQDTGAIVNAANSYLAGGSGVDGAIHAAGGPAIAEECRQIIQKIQFLPAGNAVLTGGGNLPAKYVIHAVGPVWLNGWQNEDETLAAAYRNSLQLAMEHGIRTIAFPSISTGAYRFPVRRAARVAIAAIHAFLDEHDLFDEVRLVLWSDEDLREYSLQVDYLLAAEHRNGKS
jgi:O-acetyl-ADP-ribose deacetylase (regulator of RNase III)